MRLSQISLAVTRLGGQRGVAPFSPASLFASGEQGAWYDPSDLTTMFQDLAGTTPVTADGQTVGLILDKSKGLVLGTELVTNGGPGFTDTTGWAVSNATVSASGGKLVCTKTGVGPAVYTTLATVVGKWYKVVFNWENIDTTAATILINSTGGLSITTSSTPATIYFLAVATLTYAQMQLGNGAVGTSTRIISVSAKEIAGNHATAPSDAARPLYKTSGGYSWLQFDGVDDAVSTASIDFTATDKMSIFAGVTKGSDAARQILLETGASIAAGGFNIEAPDTAGVPRYAPKAPSFVVTPSSFAAGQADVLTVQFDLAGTTLPEEVKCRVDGVAQVLIDGGWSNQTGNFVSNTVNIGARNGASLPWNGKLYSMIIRGALSSAGEITDTETWVNGKTGAY